MDLEKCFFFRKTEVGCSKLNNQCFFTTLLPDPSIRCLVDELRGECCLIIMQVMSDLMTTASGILFMSRQTMSLTIMLCYLFNNIV